MRIWLRGLRGERLQKDISKEASISIQYYSAIESGKRRPSVPVAKRIAAVLGFEWTRFFSDNNTQ